MKFPLLSANPPAILISPSPFPHRERPAAISIEIKSIDDTSNFDDFPESDILQPGWLFFSELSALVSLESQRGGKLEMKHELLTQYD